MRIALAQINSKLGAFDENAEKILKYIADAKDRRCDLVVFPEMALFGYRPSDLLERPSIVEKQIYALKKISKNMVKGVSAIFGMVVVNTSKRGKPYFNSAVLVEKGKKPKFFYKQLLPTYDVFDEYRHLEHGDTSKNIVTIKGKKTLITICEDIWAWDLPGTRNPYPINPLLGLKSKKVDLVINISASPFSLKKDSLRRRVTKETAKLFKSPLIYVNMIGAQDELIFDGGSFAINKEGKLLAQNVKFNEDLNVVDLNEKTGGFRKQKISSDTEIIYNALVLGIRDFVNKTGLENVHLGLSGGVDSAVVACLAVDALGPSKVSAFYLPGPFSSNESKTLAHQLAKNINIEIKDFEITPAYNLLKGQLEKDFSTKKEITFENLQARLRGIFLMAYANMSGSLLLTTGNKSEYATGYCTLYGDMCGGLAPIGDLLKEQVYDLAKFYNKQHEVIPQNIIKRAPTAELKPNQTDQDTLPPYPELDKAVLNIVQNKQKAKSNIEKWLVTALMKSEFKRWQAPPILRISEHAFGRGRNFPVAHKATD